MQVNIPEKRNRRESRENFTLNRMYYDKGLKQQVCVFTEIGYRKPYYIPYNFLSEDNRKFIEDNKLKQDIPNPIMKNKVQALKNEKTGKAEIKKGMKKTEQKEEIVQRERKESQKSILGMMKAVFQKGNHLFDKPVKIIGCHWRGHLCYSVLFSCKQNFRNAGIVPHEVMIEKFPGLLVEYLSRSSVKYIDS